MKHLKHFALFLIAVLALSLVIPALAQEEAPASACDTEGFCLVTGTLSFEGEDILITDSTTGEVFVVAPAGSFNPSDFQDLEDGTQVILVGSLVSEDTIQADSLELDVLDCEATPDAEECLAAAEATPEATPEMTPEATPEAEATEAADDGQQGFYCRNRDTEEQPAGARLAERFDTDYSTVIDMFCDEHMGFGQIGRLLAQDAGDERGFRGLGQGQDKEHGNPHANTESSSNGKSNNGKSGEHGNSGNNGNNGNGNGKGKNK